MWIEARGDREAERGAPDDESAPDDLATTQRITLVCAACAHRLAAEAHRLVIDGAHAHTFFNPAGIAYHVCCYAEAEGATRTCRPERFFSWFTGYAWSILACGSCAQHVGWAFDGLEKDGSFVALVAGRFIEAPA